METFNIIDVTDAVLTIETSGKLIFKSDGTKTPIGQIVDLSFVCRDTSDPDRYQQIRPISLSMIRFMNEDAVNWNIGHCTIAMTKNHTKLEFCNEYKAEGADNNGITIGATETHHYICSGQTTYRWLCAPIH